MGSSRICLNVGEEGLGKGGGAGGRGLDVTTPPLWSSSKRSSSVSPDGRLLGSANRSSVVSGPAVGELEPLDDGVLSEEGVLRNDAMAQLIGKSRLASCFERALFIGDSCVKEPGHARKRFGRHTFLARSHEISVFIASVHG